jgi:hypothetical protein
MTCFELVYLVVRPNTKRSVNATQVIKNTIGTHLFKDVIKPLFPPRARNKVPEISHAKTSFFLSSQPAKNKPALFDSGSRAQAQHDVTNLMEEIKQRLEAILFDGPD